MPVRMRGPQGQTIDVPDERVGFYAQEGYSPLSSGAEFQEAQAAAAAAPDDRGFLGSLNAVATAGLSGLTLGASDIALGSLATQNEREQILEDRRANPILSAGAEIAGGLAASFAAPGSALARTPAGYLAQAANRGVASVRAGASGATALAGQAAITGAEAAAQNVGSYLGSVALGDRDLTAEGLGGALGSGFAFGAAGGALVGGLEKGSIAARRMFSSVMEGGDDAARSAAGAWERKSTELFDANRATLDEAKAKLAAAQQAVDEATLAQRRAGQLVTEERALAQRATPASVADDVIPPPAAAPAAGAVDDPLAAIRDRIRRGEVSGESGPFTPEGLQAAAEREAAREAQRAATGGFDFAPRTGSALTEVRKAGVQAVPAPVPAASAKLAEVVAEAEDAESALMRMLMGTKAQIDEGATLGQVGAAARARPVSPKQLTAQYDDLIAKANTATDPEIQNTLFRQAESVYDEIAALPPSKQALADIDSVTQAMGRYEKAMADVADELGDAAHPATREAADALRKAETGAERAMFDRAAQAIDDAAERGMPPGLFDAPTGPEFGPFQSYDPTRLAPKERIAFAKAQKLEADAGLAKARTAEVEARTAYKGAKTRMADAQQAAKQAAGTVSLPGQPTAEAGGAGQSAADIGGVLELANMAGLGLPSPSDLPIIGPMVGLYLKARALKAGAERLMGRVPASGNAKAAALASATKDKAARAVDRMLGYVERATPAARKMAATAGPRLLEAVKERLHDDGTPAPGKYAGLQEHVAARAREISALATQPALIAQQVRREMRDVADPDMVNAAVKFRTAQIAYLDKVSPKAPPPSPFQREPWRPDKQAATDFARRYAVAMDPVQALEQVEQRSLTPEAAEAFRAVYPKMFEQTRARMLDRATQLQTTLPRAQLTRMSILFDIPLDSALEPATLSRTQSAFAATSPADPTQQQAPPAPSIAGSTNLTALYQPSSDRRDAAR